MTKRIQLRRDIKENWETLNPILAQGEIGIDLNTQNLKIGDGTSRWNSIEYAIALGKLSSEFNENTFLEVGPLGEVNTLVLTNNSIETLKISTNSFLLNIKALFDDDTASIDPYTGAVVVTGGVGIGGDLNIAGDITANKINVEEEIEANLQGDTTGTHFGDIIGNVRANNGDIVLVNGNNGNLAIFSGQVNGRLVQTTGTSEISRANINGGFINSTVIGNTGPTLITGTTITATNKFVGVHEGKHVGDVYTEDGRTLVLDNGTGGPTNDPAYQPPMFYGNVQGSISGNFAGDIYAEDGTTKILENGTGGSSGDPNYRKAEFIGNVTGDITSYSLSRLDQVDINGGNIDGTVIGFTAPRPITGTIIEATERFIGTFEGQIVGPSTGDIFADNRLKVFENGSDGLNAKAIADIILYIPDPINPATPTEITILDRGTNGTNALYTGNVLGNVQGDLLGDVTSKNITTDKLTVNNTATIDDLTVKLTTTLKGNITATKNTSSTSTTTGTVVVTGGVGISQNLNVGGNINITGNLQVDGSTNFTGIVTAPNLSYTGSLFSLANPTNLVAPARFTVETSSGDTVIKGDLTVEGATTLADLTLDNITVDNVTVNDDLDVNGVSTLAQVDINSGTIDNTTIGATTPSTVKATHIDANSITIDNYGELRLRESSTNGQNYVGLRAPSEFISSYTVTFPRVLGVDGSVLTLNKDGNKLEFSSPDLFGGGQVAVSADYGDDLFDGINKPVKTIKRALQIASGLVYSPKNQFDRETCFRDVGLILESIGWDLIYGSNWQTVKSGITYSNATAALVVTAQKDITIRSLTYLSNQIVKLIGGAEASLLAQSVQTIKTILANTNFGDIITPNQGPIPAVVMPNPAGSDSGFTYAKDHILANIGYIAAEVIGWITTNHPTFTYATDKCSRDVKYIAYSVAYDMTYGGNSQTVDAARKYFSYGDEPTVIPGEQVITQAAYQHMNYLIKQIVKNLSPVTSYQNGINRTPNTNVASSIALTKIDDLFDLIDTTIISSAFSEPTLFYPNATSNVSLVPARNTLLANKIVLQTSTVAYIADYRPNDKRIVITVASGDYVEDNPIIIPDNVSVVGAGLRACNIRPANANKDMLRVRNGCYFTEITFRDKLDVNLVPSQTFDYAVAFDDPSDLTCSRAGYINLPNTKPVISISPYVQNCSIISFLGGNGVLVDGSKVATPNVPANSIEAENPVEGPVPQQGKSMVANAFTMLSFGGTGWRVINDAYAQIVSCFQIFCLNGSYCQSGGYLSITNSATNFGQFALRATGYSPNAFDFNKGIIVATGTSAGGIPTLTAIGFGDLPVQHYIIRVRDPKYRTTYNTILNNKEELTDDLIDWIADQITNNNTPFQVRLVNGIPTVFNYDEIKCRRDTKLILEAVAYDLLSGGNNKTVEAGLSYATATSVNLINQKEQNIAAFTQLKTLTLALVPIDLQATVGDYFDLLIDIIDDIVNVPEIVDYSSRGDVTEFYKSKEPTDEITFNASVVNVNDNVFDIVGHGFTNKLKLVYTSNSNPVIGGLTDGQSYYVKEISADQFKLYTDDSLTKPIDLRGTPTGTNHKFIKNVREYFIDDLIDSHQVYQELTLQAGNYTFVQGREIQGATIGQPNKAYVLSYDPTTYKLVVSVEKVQIGNAFIRNQFTLDSTVSFDHKGSPSTFINVDFVEPVNNLYTATFKILPTQVGSSLTNLGTLPEKQLWLHRPSIVNSSSHTWEYAGSGVDYNALPQNGGRTRVEYEQVSELPGRVYSSGTNELGDFKVGDFIRAENKTGNVQFTNTVSIAALDALKLAVGNITIEEFSADIDLGDNEIGGPTHNRLSTQLAVRSFLENRLGNFIDREVSTSNVPGAIPQLNSLGKLSADLIPPIRNFIVYRSKGYRSRLKLVDSVPAISVLGGDLSIEEYSSVQLVTNGTLTAKDGDLIIQNGTGAQGVVIGGSSSNTFILGSVAKTFNASFNTTGTLTKNGAATGLTPTTVNPVIADQTANYILSELDVLQILLLDTTQTYNFTGITRVTSANNGAQGDITNLILGTCNALDNRAGIGLIGGSNYVTPPSGIYEDVPLTGGSGTGARGDVFVTNGIVSAVSLSRIGSGYIVGDNLSAAAINLGGGSPTPFTIKVSEVQNRLYLDILGALRFGANALLNDFIEDANAVTKTIDQKGTREKTFNGASTIIAGNVNTSLGQIIVTAHGYTNGDPVVYDSNGNTPIVPLVDEASYYVKVIDSNTIELYQNYNLATKINITGSGSGTHKLIIKNINIEEKMFYLPNHGYSRTDPVRVTGSALPQALKGGSVYYVGSITTNAFSLHSERTDSVLSFDGATIDPVDLEDNGLQATGTMSLTKLNIKVIGTIENSSILSENWSALSANNVDANNIISGIVNTSRLAIGQANSLTFLRGDSSWQRAVQKIKRFNDESAITITGSFETVNGNNEFYNEVTFDVDVVDSAAGREVPKHPGHTNLGVARFNKAQFEVGTGVTTGRVSIKSGVVDAGTIDGLDSLDLLDSINHTMQPVTKGGTAIGSYTAGDMLYATSVDILQKLPIGTASNILTSNGLAPLWTNSITLSSISVTGNLSNVGGASLFSANRINMQDNNLRLGVVSAISSLSGTINFTSVGTTTTTITVDNGLSTAGLIAGMSLLRISGGVLGNNARITSINSPTTFSFSSDGGITQLAGGAPITFSVGGITDFTANGGGITISGSTTKSFTWSQNSNAWNSTESLNLAFSKDYRINGTSVLSSTTLGSGVVNSSLTSVGTLGTGTWQATIISPTYGGTGVNNGTKTITLGGNLTTSGAFASTFTMTGITTVTFPTTGTLATLAGTEALTNKTVNGMTITNSTGTFTLANGKTLTNNNTLTFNGTDGSTVAFGTGGTVVYKNAPVIDNPTLNLTYTGGTNALTSVTLQSAYTTDFKSRFTSVNNNSSFSWLTNLNWSGVAWVKDNNAKGHWKIDKILTTTDTTSYISFSYGGPTNIVSTDRLKIFGTGRTELLANIASTNTTTGTLIVTGGAGISENLYIGSNLNVGGDTIITGNLTVNGTTTTVNSNTVNIGDNIIVLNADETGAPSQNSGIEIERGTSTNVSLLWDEASDKWTFGGATVVAGNFEGTIAGNSSTSTQLATSRNITLAGDVSGNAYFDGTQDITINTTVTTNSVALGTDTTGNYVASVASGTPGSQTGTSGLTISGTGEGVTVNISHADTSSVANLASDNSGTTFIQDINFTFDTFGHVTAATVDTANVGDATLTMGVSGVGLSGSATFTANSTTAQTFTVTSNATSANTANAIVARDSNGDFYGRYINSGYFNSSDDVSNGNISHIMAKFGDNYYRSATAAKVAAFISGQSMNINGNATTATTAANVNNGTLTVQGNNGLSGSGTFTANQSSNGTITLSVDSTVSRRNFNAETSNLAVGWYTIATNSGDRASAKFILRDVASSYHQSVVFYASHFFGNNSDITVLHQSAYSVTPFRYIRIVEGSTYDGAMLQIYIDSPSSAVIAYMYENDQANGWSMKNWIANGLNPGGLNNFAALTNVASQVDLDSGGDGSNTLITTGQIYAGGDTAQRKVTLDTSAARPGVTKLYRNDDDSDYNLQITWQADRTGYWSLRGYNADTYHAPAYVAYSGVSDVSSKLDSSVRNYSREWIEFPNYTGLYSPLNGAHFYPNNTSYGSWRIAGTRNGWGGLYFDTGSTLMMNSATVGFHREGYGWQMYWDSGTGYISKGNPGGSTLATILDNVNFPPIIHYKQYIYGAASTSYSEAFQVREGGLAGAQDGSAAYNPRLGFHWAGRVASSISLRADGAFSFDNNPGTGRESFYANIMYGTATSARYADLAENYVADADYEEGTVLMLGGVHEVTLAIEETRKVIGVISKNPAHLMNAELEAEHVATVALQGRVPVRVKGKIAKGDMLVSAGDGYAKAHDDPRMGMVIGKSLEDFDGEEGMIEVVVGRM